MSGSKPRGRPRTDDKFTETEMAGNFTEPALARAQYATGGTNSGEDRKERYQREKVLGLRRADGVPKLKKLNQRHLTIAALVIQGKRAPEIAREIGISAGRVYQVVNDPLVQKEIENFKKGMRTELEMMLGDTIQAVKDGLSENQPIKTRLSAVDRWTKLKQVHDNEDKEDAPAVNVTVVQNAREKLASSLQEIAGQVSAEDAEWQDVESEGNETEDESESTD